MNKIKLIIGLGNPGKEYEYTRHNVGFLFIDELENDFKIKNLKSKITVLKSKTFMNESGKSVVSLLKSYKVAPQNTLIVHDDIDILWSKFKFSFGQSSAGHKGVESVIKALKTKNFWRLRVGIHPTQNTKVRADKIILKKFTEKEMRELKETIKKTVSKLETAF